jgi:glycosyltransferase involved in cell wall biosynthesis
MCESDGPRMAGRRVTIVGSELLGRPGTGGAGTADSLLAVALGRHGHEVELLTASGREIGTISEEWMQIYGSSGVRIRLLDALANVGPPYLARSLEVLRALSDEPREVVIANDWRGLAYLPLRARQTGMALTDAAFVIHCHGPGRVLTEFAQKIPDTLERFGEAGMERACIGLADAVVSPSAWLLDWMRQHAWAVPESARVIQYIRQSAALDETPEHVAVDGPVRRLVFFGQLREGKGIRIYLSSLDKLEPRLLDGLELLFLGSDRGRWTADRVMDQLTPGVQEQVAGIRFEPGLDRDAALAELCRPGVLAVMPSLLDNSPNTVSECIEYGVPFVATEIGGIPELVSESDRARVLCPPTAEALTRTLTNALTSVPGFAPAQPARQPAEALDQWLDVVEHVTPPSPRRACPTGPVAVIASGDESERRAQRLAESTHSVEVDVVRVDSRRDGIFRTSADWVVFLDDEDKPEDEMLDALVSAQEASGVDVVTCAVETSGGDLQLFLGDPGALGLVDNQYGVVGLVRASLVVAEEVPDGFTDPDWPLFANLALAGAKVVSSPRRLVAGAGKPGSVVDVPGDGVAVLEAFERHAATLKDLPQLAATVAAALIRATAMGIGACESRDSFLQRARRRLTAR